MIPQNWTPEASTMWAKLQAFSPGTTEALYGYRHRLAKENNWSHVYADRVIEEYKRFLFLAVHAGHAVTPSEPLDQAWHLHLVYTRSYWQDLCGEILGRPLHHEPTTGGLSETAKFREQFARTIQSYRSFFGEDPPADIWLTGDADAASSPAKQKTPRPEPDPRWVDIARHWLVPKPLWLHRVTRRVRPHLALTAMAVLVLTFGIMGCTGDMNVFDYRGEDFLNFYLGAFLVATIASLLLGKMARSGLPARPGVEPPTDPYEIAFLSGGGRQMVDAALAALHSRGLLAFGRNSHGVTTVGFAPGALKPGQNPLEKHPDLSPIEQQLCRALPARDQEEIRHVRKALEPTAQAMQDELADKGWIMTAAALASARFATALPMLILLGVGITKWIIGLSRHKPVGFLFLLMILTIVALMFCVRGLKRRTRAGDQAWKAARQQYLSARGPRHAPSYFASPQTTASGVAPVAGMDPYAMAMLVGVGGTAALASMPQYEELRRAILNPHPATGTNTGCGTTTSSCGSAGGSCGGGGDSGGGGSSGCGGCSGGGGGD